MLDVPKALAELRVKTLEEIESETAYAWASRALAALQFYQSTGDLRWLLNCETYKGEALEHAAFAPPGVLEELRQVLCG